MTYLISYESNEMLHDYTPVMEMIKTLGEYQHPMSTLWFVRTNYTANDIYDHIRPLLREKDHIFVVEVNQQKNRQGWLAKSFWQWLKQE